MKTSVKLRRTNDSTVIDQVELPGRVSFEDAISTPEARELVSRHFPDLSGGYRSQDAGYYWGVMHIEG